MTPTINDLETAWAWLNRGPDLHDVLAALTDLRARRDRLDTAVGTLAAHVMTQLGLEDGDEPDCLREGTNF
jgi:hypothetical protein